MSQQSVPPQQGDGSKNHVRAKPEEAAATVVRKPQEWSGRSEPGHIKPIGPAYRTPPSNPSNGGEK